jgi:adenylate cyclase
LDRILSSPDFHASKRRKGFLRFVVEEVLAGRDEMIKAYTIAVTVFGRGNDFDPQIDPIVSVEAGRLRRALEHYYLSSGRNNALRIEIPKGTFVPSFLENKVGSVNVLPTDPAIGSQSDVDISTPKLTGPGIAVIVFESLSKEEEQDFFATGISAQLVANLAQFKDFIVVGPLLRERLEDPNLSLSAIGAKYGVQFVLTGSVQRRGGSYQGDRKAP